MKQTIFSATVTASVLALLGVLAPSRAEADDAKKEALRHAKALAVCAADYASALAACEQRVEARACYAAADAADLACRQAENTVGHSDVAIDPSLFPVAPHRIGAKPLDCTGLFPTVCAEGHARPATCFGFVPGPNGGEVRVEVPQNVDSRGNADACSGQPLNCPEGFAPLAHPGVDLCWDSARNRNQFAY